MSAKLIPGDAAARDVVSGSLLVVVPIDQAPGAFAKFQSSIPLISHKNVVPAHLGQFFRSYTLPVLTAADADDINKARKCVCALSKTRWKDEVPTRCYRSRENVEI
jgi:hypothetical protein